MPKRFVILFGILAVFAAAGVYLTRAGWKPRDPSAAQIDEIFAQWNKRDSPGCSVGVSRGGKIVYERGYGLASLELQVPLSPASVFEAASISKQFTAISILLLAQRGQLSFDDDVRKYLPELRDYGSPLTVRHLLNHTSGLRDAFILIELAPPPDPDGDRNDQILQLLARQRSLNYTPGSEWMYNNGAYALLAVIVKRVSGQSLAAFADVNLFRPLGMTSTRFQDDPAVLIPSAASNYRRADGTWRFVPDAPARGAVGNSGLWTSTGDLLRWVQNLADVRVGSKALLDEMQQPTILIGGNRVNWGMGFQVGEHRGAKFIGHGGNDAGIDNFVAWYPEQHLGIAVLCNTDEARSIELSQHVADLYLGEGPDPRAASVRETPAAAVLSDAQIQSKAGLYREADGGSFINFFVRDGQLRGATGTGTGDSFPLIASSENRFMIPGTEVAFEFGPGQAQTVRGFIEPGMEKTFERMAEFKPTSAQLRAYAGTYYSPEVDVTWAITEGGSGLVIRRPARADTAAAPLASDVFTTIGDFMNFSRDGRGNVNGLEIFSSGLRGLRFERVNR